MVPSRSKRKFHPEPTKDGALRSLPTLETQELYDAFRRIEDEQQALADHIQLQNNNENPEHLQLPAHSQAPTSPQSLSYASTTHSLTHALDEVEIGQDESDNNKKRRAMRHGPLGARKQARAAFMRKLGVCQQCRARKVLCSHWDNTAFEAKYQARKQKSRAPPVSVQARNIPATPQPAYPDPTPNQLVHTGSWQFSNSSSGNVPGTDGAQADMASEIENLLRRETPSTTAVPEPAALFGIPERGHPDLLEFGSTFPDLGLPQIFQNGNFQVNLFGNQSTQADSSPPETGEHVPVGRNMGGGRWECRHGEGSVPLFGVQAAVCSRMFQTQLDLRLHFEAEHAPLSRRYTMWKCLRACVRDGRDVCGFMMADPSQPCLQCSLTLWEGGTLWEEWHYGIISRPPSLTSGPSGRVVSHDGSFLSAYGQAYNPGQHPQSAGQSTFQTRWPGRNVGGNYPGSHQSYSTRPATSKSKDLCYRQWPYGKTRRDLSRSLQRSSKVPLLVIASVLLMIFLENWLWRGLSLLVGKRSWGGTRSNVLWGSLLCVVAGAVLMWMFKRVRFRPDYGHGTQYHRDGMTSNSLGTSRLDLENARSIRGDDEGMRGVMMTSVSVQ